MKIKSINIHNFRSFIESWEIKLNYKLWKPITIFWGNNSWKSNFIKALLYWIWYKYGWDYSFKKEDFYLLETEKNLWVSVYLGDLPEPYETYSYTSFSADYLDWTPEVKQKIISWTNSKSLWKDWRRNIPFFYIDSENLKEQFRTKTSFWTYTPFWRYINSLKEDFNSNFEYYPEEISWKDIKRLDFLRSLLGVISENIIKTEKVELFLNDFNSKLEWLELNFWINEEDFFDKIDLLISDSEDKPNMPISNLWSWFIFEILLTFFEVISKSNDWNIFLINKPEAFLDDVSQEKFYKKLKKISENNQVIIISSSIKFLDFSESRSIIKLENYENLWTEFKQTYYINKKVDNIKLLQESFPEFKKWLLYKKVILISDLKNYLKIKKDFPLEPIFYVHFDDLEKDLDSTFNDLWVFVKFIKSEEINLDEIKDFLQ